jgi:GT2 family glycosyltransferase
MTSPSLVAIIILNWNSWPDTLACVASCRKLTWPNVRIVIVDNGSTDRSEEIFKERCPDVEIIQTGANLGFAGGNNIGIGHALELGAEYVWLLNNDAVAGPEALTMLVEAMEAEPAAAVAGSKIYYHDDPVRIWCAGGIWRKGRLRLRQRGANQLDKGQFDRLVPVGSVSGCSMLLRTSAIREIGLLDEVYFLYWEDTDWCARAGRHGYSVLFVPASRVWHKVSATVAARSHLQYYYNTRNGLIFCMRHDRASLPVFLLYVAADVSVGLLRGNRNMLRGAREGVADFLRGASGPRSR